jgi:threonine aldolase
MPVETNILIFQVKEGYTAQKIAKLLEEKNIKVMAISSKQVRLVTHLDISEEMVRITISAINEIN